jgi:zinc transporter ZupT
MTPVGAVIGAMALGRIPQYVLPFILGAGAGTFLFISATAILPEVMHMKPTKFEDIAWTLGGYVGFIWMESLFGAHAHG